MLKASITPWTGQDFFFKFISLHNCGERSNLQSSDYWKMYICVPSPAPMDDLIICPLCRTYSIIFLKKFLPYLPWKAFSKKDVPPIPNEEDTMPLSHWKVM